MEEIKVEIFDDYCKEVSADEVSALLKKVADIGYNTIAYQLNQLNIPALNGKWGQTSVVNILNNEVYLGKIRWRREPVKRVIEDGMLTKKRYTNDNYDLYDGMHEPIITQ